MGKNLIQQARGKGSPTYRAHSFRWKYTIGYRKYDEVEKTGFIKGRVVDIIDGPGHNAPIAKIVYENGDKIYNPAFENLRVDQDVYSGVNSPLVNGSILPLSKIPEGTLVYNIESQVGDGGCLVRTSGGFAKVVTSGSKVVVLLPSKKQKEFDPKCRATIGIIAGSGRKEKFLVKAGKNHYQMRAKGKLYPRTSGVAMNAVDHPFGSGRGRHIGKPKTIPRFAPPGRKVGLLRAKRTGRAR